MTSPGFMCPFSAWWTSRWFPGFQLLQIMLIGRFSVDVSDYMCLCLVGMHLAVGLLGYRAHLEFSSLSVPVYSRSRSLLTGSCCSVSSTNIQCQSFSSNHLGGCAVLWCDLVTLLWLIMRSNTFSCVLAIRISLWMCLFSCGLSVLFLLICRSSYMFWI